MNSNNQIKAIIFDLGNVLIHVDFENMLINRADNKLNRSPKEVVEAAYADELFKQFCRGDIGPTAFYKRLIKKYSLNMSYAAFEERWCDIFKPVEGMSQLLDILRPNFKIGLLSDTDPIHWRYVSKKYPYLQSIDNPSLSFELGYMKPHPKTYIKAAENVGEPVQNCLFIDDRMVNVDGALKTGMKAVHFENIEQLRSELRRMDIL
ncbi:MAG: HAD family phosphatase [Calditrichaceae bacterium]